MWNLFTVRESAIDSDSSLEKIMKNFFIVVLLAFVTTLFAVGDADAKSRLGGGKSTGMQRENVQAAPKAPAQNTVAPASAAAPAAAPPSGMSRWMAPSPGLPLAGCWHRCLWVAALAASK